MIKNIITAAHRKRHTHGEDYYVSIDFRIYKCYYRIIIRTNITLCKKCYPAQAPSSKCKNLGSLQLGLLQLDCGIFINHWHLRLQHVFWTYILCTCIGRGTESSTLIFKFSVYLSIFLWIGSIIRDWLEFWILLDYKNKPFAKNQL